MSAPEAGYTRPPDPPEPRDTCGTCAHWEPAPGNPWTHIGVCRLWTLSTREIEWRLDSEQCDEYEE